MKPTDPYPSSVTDGEAVVERIHRQLLGALEPEEFVELERDLLASPALRASYRRAVTIDVALHDEASRRHEAAAQPAAAGRVPSRRLRQALLVAAAAVVATVGLWRFVTPPPAAAVGALPAAPREVATLADSRGCQWPDGHHRPVQGRLATGILELSAGVALIEFDGGARLVLQGPATLELVGPKVARLHRGNATVRCEEGLYSFSLLTPTSSVTDLGTEFGVSVEPGGPSEVHVLDGEVEVAEALAGELPATRFLNAGETLLLASNGENHLLKDSTKQWIRDYTSHADREAGGVPPRVIARDVFPVEANQPKRFSLGTGWRGAWWQATAGRQGDFRFVPLAPLLKRDGSAGLAMLVGGWVEVRRTLAEPIDPSKPQTVYLGFSLDRMNSTQRDKTGKLSEATVMFRSSRDPTAVLGMALSGRNHWVVLEQGGWERSEQPAPGKGPYFVVVKIELNPWRGNKVSMQGYDDLAAVPSQEPAEWGFVTRRQLAKLTEPLDVIALQVRQTPFKFGEITVGNSWQAVAQPTTTGK